MCWGNPGSVPERPTDEEIRCKKCGEYYTPENHYFYYYYGNYRNVCRKKTKLNKDKGND
jgi:hypothetical protein